MGTKVDIEKTLHSYLCKKCLLCFDMLKSDYFALIGVLPCNFLILKIRVFMVVVRVDRPRGLDSWTVPENWTCGPSPRIGLVDPPQGLDLWTVPKDWTHGPSLVDRPRMEP